MLRDADSNANPTKYAQNKRHGIYEGTADMMNCAPERCSAPKTANGMAKHKLLKATILSRPPARAISVFADHSAIRKSRIPALHIETAVREMSKNAARMIECMCMPRINLSAPSRARFHGSIQRANCTTKEQVIFTCEAGRTPDFKRASARAQLRVPKQNAAQNST